MGIRTWRSCPVFLGVWNRSSGHEAKTEAAAIHCTTEVAAGSTLLLHSEDTGEPGLTWDCVLLCGCGFPGQPCDSGAVVHGPSLQADGSLSSAALCRPTVGASPEDPFPAQTRLSHLQAGYRAVWGKCESSRRTCVESYQHNRHVTAYERKHPSGEMEPENVPRLCVACGGDKVSE